MNLEEIRTLNNLTFYCRIAEVDRWNFYNQVNALCDELEARGKRIAKLEAVCMLYRTAIEAFQAALKGEGDGLET